jgi:hypothetical protein
MNARVLATAIGLIALAGMAPSTRAESKIVLVTTQEAALPSVPNAQLTRRGITRGPQIVLVSPPADNATVQSPMHLQLKFESHGGAKIDPAAVKVMYLKNPTVDLTDRVKPYIQSTGLDIGEADVPPGSHMFRVDVKDSDGRVTTALFSFVVNK